MIDTYTNACVLACATLAAGYVARLMLVRWWRSAIGWERMLTGAVYVIVFGLAAAYTLGLRDYPGRQYVRAGCWTALVLVFGAKLWLLLASQRAGRRKLLKGRRDHGQDS